MAQSVKQILSSLATDVKAVNLDDRVSFRFLHTKFNDKIGYFLRLEAKSREILKDTTLWRSLDFIELIDVDDRLGLNDCFTLKRSKKKLPEAFNTNYGQLIKIFTLDHNIELKLIKASDYGDYTKRQYRSAKTFAAYIENGYLYIPNVTWQAVKGLIIAKNPIEVDKFNGTVSKCASPLDGEVAYPDYLIALAKREVLNELAGAYKRIVEDEKGDDNTNIKN